MAPTSRTRSWSRFVGFRYGDVPSLVIPLTTSPLLKDMNRLRQVYDGDQTSGTQVFESNLDVIPCHWRPGLIQIYLGCISHWRILLRYTSSGSHFSDVSCLHASLIFMPSNQWCVSDVWHSHTYPKKSISKTTTVNRISNLTPMTRPINSSLMCALLAFWKLSYSYANLWMFSMEQRLHQSWMSFAFMWWNDLVSNAWHFN